MALLARELEMERRITQPGFYEHSLHILIFGSEETDSARVRFLHIQTSIKRTLLIREHAAFRRDPHRLLVTSGRIWKVIVRAEQRY